MGQPELVSAHAGCTLRAWLRDRCTNGKDAEVTRPLLVPVCPARGGEIQRGGCAAHPTHSAEEVWA